MALDLLWGTFAAPIADRPWSARSSQDRFNVLEYALRQKIRRPPVRHPAVQYAVDALERSPGARSVDVDPNSCASLHAAGIVSKRAPSSAVRSR